MSDAVFAALPFAGVAVLFGGAEVRAWRRARRGRRRRAALELELRTRRPGQYARRREGPRT